MTNGSLLVLTKVWESSVILQSQARRMQKATTTLVLADCKRRCQTVSRQKLALRGLDRDHLRLLMSQVAGRIKLKT